MKFRHLILYDYNRDAKRLYWKATGFRSQEELKEYAEHVMDQHGYDPTINFVKSSNPKKCIAICSQYNQRRALFVKDGKGA